MPKSVDENYQSYESVLRYRVPCRFSSHAKSWHEWRRQRVCSLPLGDCFSDLLTGPKHTHLWWLSRCLPGLMHASVPALISCCQRWQEVICRSCSRTERRACNWFWCIQEERWSWLSFGRQSARTKDSPIVTAYLRSCINSTFFSNSVDLCWENNKANCLPAIWNSSLWQQEDYVWLI